MHIKKAGVGQAWNRSLELRMRGAMPGGGYDPRTLKKLAPGVQSKLNIPLPRAMFHFLMSQPSRPTIGRKVRAALDCPVRLGPSLVSRTPGAVRISGWLRGGTR